MEYVVLGILAVTPAVLLAVVRRSYNRGIEEADLEADETQAAPTLPADFEKRLAPVMAVLVFAFLVVLSAMIPAVNVGEVETAEEGLRSGESLGAVVSELESGEEVAIELQLHHLEMLFGLWAVFAVEAFVGLVLYWNRWNRKRKILAVVGAFVPPLRLIPGHGCAPNIRYVPFVGWEETSKLVLARLERAFSGPMLLVALLILPLLAMEYVWQVSISEGGWLFYTTDIGTRAIWLTFAVEFFVLVAASPNKLAYCKSHWLDLAIILLPLIYFLRCLRILRLGRLANMQKMQKMTRVYRLRGVALRLLRTIIVLKLADRMGGWATRKRLGTLRAKLRTMEEEMDEIKREIVRIEAALEECDAVEGKAALAEGKGSAES